MGSESYTEAIHRLQSSSTVLPTKQIESSALSHSQNVFKGLPPFPVKKETHSPQDLETADMDIVEESDLNTLLEDPPRKKGHRRSHSESVFYKTHNVGDEEQSDREEAACSDDLFALYIDMDKINNPVSDVPSRDRESWIKSLVDSSIGKSNTLPCETRSNKRPSHHARSVSVDGLVLTELHKEASTAVSPTMSSDSTTSRHFHSNSMDGSINFRIDLDGEVRKLNPNDKLAEIALVDPKRAKRILANRQSAARSKERKVRYISELERKVQTLQTEATSLSAQLTIFQRDSTGLTNENNELKLRLRGMEQEAQLRDALNDALREEIQMLKMKMVSTQPEYMQTGYFVKSEETNTSTPKF